MKIGGKTKIELQTRTTTENDIGEQVESWKTVEELVGFLDLSGGDSKYTIYNAKIEQSTHVFICDYKLLDERVKSEKCRVFAPQMRKYYDVMLIDNPMELNKQLEIYLKYTGGANGEN